MTREILELNTVRLEEDLTFAALAAELKLSKGALFNILHRKSTPHERTLYKIRRFLDERKPVTPRARKAR